MLKWFKKLLSSDASGRRPYIRVRAFRYGYQIPADLGIRPELAQDAYGLVARLKAALPESYMSQVRSRVLFRHPDNAKYRWMELEMARFFALTVLLKNVPMYSDDTDLIWHEMLMFTREYQKFCDDFAGFSIHHQPNVNPDSDPAALESRMAERDVFELVYASLFVVTPENKQLLGPFYRRRISPRLMSKIESMDENRLRALLGFRETNDPVLTAVQAGILRTIRAKTEQARSYHADDRSGSQSAYYGGIDPLWAMLAFGMATELSPFNPIEADAARERRDSSCSSGTAFGSTDGDSSHDSGGGSDGPSSSCSSSSCGSSCGGGGD